MARHTVVNNKYLRKYLVVDGGSSRSALFFKHTICFCTLFLKLCSAFLKVAPRRTTFWSG